MQIFDILLLSSFFKRVLYCILYTTNGDANNFFFIFDYNFYEEIPYNILDF